MKSATHTPAVIALAIAAALAAGSVAPGAQAANASPVVSGAETQAAECQRSSRGARRADSGSRQQEKVEERYPNATRESPSEGASSRMAQRLNRLNEAMNDSDYPLVKENIDSIKAKLHNSDND